MSGKRGVKRAWITGSALLFVGSLLGAACPIFWLHLLILAPFACAYMWLVTDYSHSDFAWWCVLNPRESPKILLVMAFVEYLKLKWRWKLWQAKRAKKKKK